MTGQVRSRQDTYGFIRADDGRSFFFHNSDLVGDVDVETSDRVTFEVVTPTPEKGPRAKDVARDFGR